MTIGDDSWNMISIDVAAVLYIVDKQSKDLVHAKWAS